MLPDQSPIRKRDFVELGPSTQRSRGGLLHRLDCKSLRNLPSKLSKDMLQRRVQG